MLELRFSKKDYVNAYIGYFLLSYNTMAKACFQFFECEKVGSRSVVSSYPAVLCDSHEYQKFLYVSAVFDDLSIVETQSITCAHAVIWPSFFSCWWYSSSRVPCWF